MITMHASAVALEGRAILLRGPSGHGKSDLALRLMDEGADLISDDYVELSVENDHIIARPPETIRGMMEVRGLGLMTVPFVEKAPLVLAFNLMPSAQVDRFPMHRCNLFIDGSPVPLLNIDGMAASSPAKIRLALSQLAKFVDEKMDD